MSKAMTFTKILCGIAFGIIFFQGVVPLVYADVLINVMAVNGAATKKETSVRFNLPSDLTAPDILDTDGLQLDYDVEDANYYVHGQVILDPKQSKTFKIRVKDIWKVDPSQLDNLKKEIEEGYKRLGVAHDQKNADQLKGYLENKLNYIIDDQTTRAESVEKRIDSFRAYDKELRRIKNSALAVDYWRSNLNEVTQLKLIRLTIEVENPKKSQSKTVKYRQFLPLEVKPEHVIESEGFEIRFDQQRQQPFLFKEEEIPPGEKKKYTVGIQDIWTVSQREIDYFRFRDDQALSSLMETRFEESAKILDERIKTRLKAIEESQSLARPIEEHISVYRDNLRIFTEAKTDVETLEKLLAVYRENLEKSKVNNILQKVQTLNNVSNVSKAVFNKKFETTTAWGFIGWILSFVGVVIGLSLVFWLIRSKDKAIVKEVNADKTKNSGDDQQQEKSG